jgi:hypothetical protein
MLDRCFFFVSSNHLYAVEQKQEINPNPKDVWILFQDIKFNIESFAIAKINF